MYLKRSTLLDLSVVLVNPDSEGLHTCITGALRGPRLPLSTLTGGFHGPLKRCRYESIMFLTTDVQIRKRLCESAVNFSLILDKSGQIQEFTALVMVVTQLVNSGV